MDAAEPAAEAESPRLRMSKPSDLILIGGGEHARVLAEAAVSRPELWRVIGFVDPQPCPETERRLGLRAFTSDEEALREAGSTLFVLGIGRIRSSGLRRNIVARYTAAGARWATVIHRTAWVSPTATVAPGAVVFASAVVQTGANLGAHVVVNTGAIVEHDVSVGDFTLVAPGVAVGGGTVIGPDAYLGLGCRIRDHLQIGSGVTVGMGAVVTRSVRDSATVVGVPARESQN